MGGVDNSLGTDDGRKDRRTNTFLMVFFRMLTN